MNLIHKEFLIALANGEEVEHKLKYSSEWFVTGTHHSLMAFNNPNVEFRIKPKTVTLSMEIPMPFVPDVGEYYWQLSDHKDGARAKNVNDAYDNRAIAMGVYRTKDEASQACKAHEAAIAKLLECAK